MFLLNQNRQSIVAKVYWQISFIHFIYPQVQEMREVLNEEWVWFQQVLIDSNIMLQKHKEKFKSSLILSSEEFKKKIQTALQEFNNTGLTLSLLLCHSLMCIITICCSVPVCPE